MEYKYNDPRRKFIRQKLRNGATKAEKLLWRHLKGRGLGGYKFRRQYEVNKYVVDFYCTQVRLAVELDGWSHDEVDAREYDRLRQFDLEAEDITVLRFPNNEICRNIDIVLKKIKQTCDTLLGIFTPPPM